MLFSTHVNHVSFSPTNGIGPTQGQRKTLTRVGNELTHAHNHFIRSISSLGCAHV